MNEAIEARNYALKLVTDHNKVWMDRALNTFGALKHWFHERDEWTGESMRLAISEFIGEPDHHNAWGALIRTALERGHIERTGEYRPMKTKKSHGRMTPVYRIK